MRRLIDKLQQTHHLARSEWISLIKGHTPELQGYAAQKARTVRESAYGRDVFIRGLIEISSYCKNDCYYCGIRKSNGRAQRYRLSSEEILSCAETGYRLGFRTIVLQGGEDGYYTDDLLCPLIEEIKRRHPDCAVTLSLGEREPKSFQRLFDAGADRYLLRHETANESHYRTLHPASLHLENRKKCLFALKETGYQVGSGFLVGSPYQTPEDLAEDFIFLEELDPQMVGIGPFLPHHDTPFAGHPAGSAEKTLYCLSLLRLMLPHVLLPATTALGTLCPKGRELGIKAGANVVMPNLSPADVRKKYLLYDNKLGTGCEAAESLEELKEQMERIGYHVTVDRGDYRIVTTNGKAR